MKTLKATSPDILQTSNTKNFGSPFSGEVQDFSNQLLSTISAEKQNKLQEKNEKMKTLLKQLEDAVKNRSDEVGYDYHPDDYHNRLLQDENLLEISLRKKVLTGDVENIYNQIINLIDDKKSIKCFEKKLFDDYLKDLTIESLEKRGMKNIDVISMNIKSEKDINKNFIKNISKIEHVDFSNDLLSFIFNSQNINIGDLSDKYLEIIFSNIKKVKSINLADTNLGKLNTKSLEIIFSNLVNVKSIDLANIDIGNFEDDKLNIIFKNLKNIEVLKIDSSNLWDKNKLDIIFGNLGKLKYLNLGSNEIGYLSNDCLYNIFKNLKELKYLFIGDNELGNLDKDKINTIFSNIKNLKSVDLYENDFSEIKNNDLDSIFKYISNCNYIGMSDSDLPFSDKNNPEDITYYIDFFKYLKNPKILDIKNTIMSENDKKYILSLLPNTKITFLL